MVAAFVYLEIKGCSSMAQCKVAVGFVYMTLAIALAALAIMLIQVTNNKQQSASTEYTAGYELEEPRSSQ